MKDWYIAYQSKSLVGSFVSIFLSRHGFDRGVCLHIAIAIALIFVSTYSLISPTADAAIIYQQSDSSTIFHPSLFTLGAFTLANSATVHGVSWYCQLDPYARGSDGCYFYLRNQGNGMYYFMDAEFPTSATPQLYHADPAITLPAGTYDELLTVNTGGNSVITRGTSGDLPFIVLTGDGNPYQVITGHITEDTTLASNEVYLFSGQVTIDSGVTLTLGTSTIIKFDTATSSGIIVNGVLNATSTENYPIYFTSFNDDEVGGDSNGTSTAPAAGDWGQISVETGATVNMQNVVIRYGGNPSNGELRNHGGTLTANNLTVASSSSYGIQSDSSTANSTLQAIDVFANGDGINMSDGENMLLYGSSTIHGNVNGIYQTGGKSRFASNDVYGNSNYGTFFGNVTQAVIDTSYIHNNSKGIYINGSASGTVLIIASHILSNTYGIYINSGYATIGSNIFGSNSYGAYNNTTSTSTAKYNYWGSSSGPSGVGPGSGDQVSNHIDYTPHLTSEHYLIVGSSGSIQSSVHGKAIFYDGTINYPAAWFGAIKVWNDYANGVFGVLLSTTTGSTNLDLEYVSRPDLVVIAYWSPSGNSSPDTLTFNTPVMAINQNLQQATIEHELGHALGLGHSYPGNIMNYLISTSSTVLGPQDTSDYDYLNANNLWP